MAVCRDDGGLCTPWSLPVGGGVYGCLFSVPVQVELVCQVQGGVIERQLVESSPEVQSVPLGLAIGLEEVDGVLAQVDRQGTLAAVAFVERTTTAQLRCSAAQVIE